MKKIGVAVMALAVLAAGPAFAQQPGGKPDEQRPPGASTPGAGPAPAGPGMMMPMEMCRQMMAMHGGRGPMGGGMMGPMTGGMMGPMMMPMMEGGTADPKAAAEMLQMRGEMMKAIGDIMMKYGQRMQSER